MLNVNYLSQNPARTFSFLCTEPIETYDRVAYFAIPGSHSNPRELTVLPPLLQTPLPGFLYDKYSG